MKRTMHPVDVICVCSSEGKIQPLRMRVDLESEEVIRIDIEDVLKVTEISHVGAEAHIYLCRARIHGRNVIFELKYTFRSHSWCLLRRIC